MELLLKDGFEIEEGAEVKVQTVLAYAGVDDESQRLVTRPLKEIFPGVHKRRENKHLVMTRILIYLLLYHMAVKCISLFFGQG